jgi:hypothetical protein
MHGKPLVIQIFEYLVGRWKEHCRSGPFGIIEIAEMGF